MPPETDAIQQDVSSEQQVAAADATTTEAETKERPKSEREIAMEALGASRLESLAADGVVLDPADTDAQISAQTEGVKEQVTEAVTEAVVETKPAEEPQMVKVKVNGVEELVPLDKVVAQYQKSSAADKRLEEATRLLEEAREQHAKAATVTEKKAAAEQIVQAQEGVAALKKQFFDSLFEGNQEDAKSAFDKIINESVATALKGREQPATPDEASIIAKVAPAVEQSLAVKSALTQFRKDFPNLAKDPHLSVRAYDLADQLVADGKSYDEALKEAGTKTIDWMRETLGVKSTVTVSTTRTEKTGRKAEIDNPQTASVKTVMADAPQEQNVAQSIADMRKTRIGG
jgi:hypothetical protein